MFQAGSNSLLFALLNLSLCRNNSGFAALNDACKEGRLEMVRMLMDKGADTNVQDSEGVGSDRVIDLYREGERER